MDKTKSYKIRGGKLVERTAEERAKLERRKAEYYGNARKVSPPRSKEPFVMLTMPQLEKLFGLRSQACTLLFMTMLYENFRHRGKTFILPTDKLATLKGLSRPNLRRALLQLEACGLISVVRMPPKPPEITVL